MVADISAESDRCAMRAEFALISGMMISPISQGDIREIRNSLQAIFCPKSDGFWARLTVSVSGCHLNVPEQVE
jgi:hypothetical protein